MRLRIALLGASMLPLSGGVALAQTSQPTPAADQRLDQFERRLNEMESKHQADLKARDEEIARLRQELTRVREQQKTSSTASADDIERTKQDVLKDIEDNHPAAPTIRLPASFNPDIAVVSDFLGSWSSNRENNALNRVDVREVELDLRAAVDPRADGVAILSFHRDVENPVFPGPTTYADQSGPDTGVDVEEAYLFLHDFGVPNLTAKLGRFHVRFGRQNLLHLHDLPTSDPPLVNQAFLAPEALSDSGLSLSYVVPPDLTGGQYVEMIGEVLAGEGDGSESPTLRGDLSIDSPAFNTHVLWNTDVAKDWNLELGGSWLAGHADSDNSHDVNLYGGDVTLIHTDPSGRFFNQLFQAEAIYAHSFEGDGV
jgi:hypothetical protein